MLDSNLNTAADVFLDDLIRLKPGESMLLCTDETTDSNLLQSICKTASNRGADCMVLELATDLGHCQVVNQIVDAVRLRPPKVLCELSDYSYYQSRAWPAARAAGARINSLTGLDAAAFIRCVETVDHLEMYRCGQKLRRILRKAKFVRINSPAGTDVTMSLRQCLAVQLINRLVGKQTAQRWRPTGILRGRNKMTFLGGQLAFQPEPGSFNGVAVIDGYLWPPKECGQLSESLEWHFRDSKLCSTQGPDHIRELLNQHLGEKGTFVEHLCVGLHPNAILAGGLLEAERVNGCTSVGIGRGTCHIDGVMKEATVTVDGVVVQGQGRLVHPALT